MGVKEGSDFFISRKKVDPSSPYLKHVFTKLTENCLSLSFMVP
jgi:hypothetical protein